MKEKPRVCLIAPPFLPVPAVKGGGRETLIELLIQMNEKYQYLDLHVYSPFHDQARALSSKYGNTFFHFVTNKGPSAYKAILWKPKRALQRFIMPSSILNPYYKEVAESIETGQFDLIIDEAGPHPDLRGVCKNIEPEKVGVHLHCVVNPSRELAGIAGFSISVSDYVDRIWTSNAINRGANYVIKNGVDTSKFSYGFRSSTRAKNTISKRVAADGFNVLYCGRIAPEKGLIQLIEAMNLIDDPSIRLLIAGDKDANSDPSGSYYRDVMEAVDRSGGRLLYLGYVDNDALADVYALSDIQVIPTMCEEAAGLVAIEGMLMGLPQIVADSGGLIEYVDSTCSIVIHRDASFASKVAEAIVCLAGDDELRNSLSEGARRRGLLFSAESFYTDFVNCIYKQMMGPNE